MTLKNNYNILICPLEWGLGHAGRMIPLAAKLRDLNNNVFIGAGEEHLSLFRTELRGLSYIVFRGFRPVYSRFLPQYLALLLETPILFYFIIRDHMQLKSIIRKYNIDIVISDNRFGLWNRKVTTVYITHMPVIPFPKPFRFLEVLGILFHRQFIKKYSFCYIPDLPGEINISGRLSHGLTLSENVRYIGILSRFSGDCSSDQISPEEFGHYTVILSGPEPQKGVLKRKLIKILKEKELPILILEGKPGSPKEFTKSGNIMTYSHLPSFEMKNLIKGSKSIITRSGYSTIMELISLKCSALLIPTPGQTEQEYLAEYLMEKGWFTVTSQKDLDSTIFMPGTKAIWTDEIIKKSSELLNNALTELLKR